MIDKRDSRYERDPLAVMPAGAMRPLSMPVPQPTLATVIIERIRAGATLEETKEYYKFIRQIQADEAKAAFDADFVQLKLRPIPKGGFNPSTKKNYERLEDILVIEPDLAERNFRLRFDIEDTETTVKAEAILVHRGGHSISAARTLPIDKSGSKNIIQAYGSTQTYAMRYAVRALLSLRLSDSEDDDGNGNGKRENPHVTQAADIVDVPAANDPDRIPAPKDQVPELPKMQQREVGDKLGKELAALKTIADVENWKNLESTSYRVWQLREMWREILQGRVKEKLMELRGAAAQAAFEHERAANELAQYEGYTDNA